MEDLSRNGTFINRKRVPKDVLKPLVTGDKLLLGPAIPQKAEQDIEYAHSPHMHRLCTDPRIRSAKLCEFFESRTNRLPGFEV